MANIDTAQSSTVTILENDVAISIKGLGKAYRIWRDPTARLKAPLWDTIGSLVPKFIRPKALKERLSHEGKSRYYTDFHALEHLDLDIKKGEAIGIIGRNGSGKSTLLQMIAGTLAPTKGQIEVKGRVAALLELGSGFNPEFTGRENVFLNASVLGLTEKETKEKLDDILAFADIGDFIDQPVKTYSSGMNMRLAFSVIAHVEADILIVDEALAVGDVFFVQKCMRFIRDFKKKGTLILVTHDTSTVQSLCDRAVWLHHGACKLIGSTKNVSEHYLEAIYAERQGVTLFKNNKTDKINKRPKKIIPTVDQRLKYINQTPLRNDLKIFSFDPDAKSFGAGGARIISVDLLDSIDKRPLSYIVGGETVLLKIAAEFYMQLDHPILGFLFYNSRGQDIFSDNTYLTYENNPINCNEGTVLIAEFLFQMPILLKGDYSIGISIANGTQTEHIQHHFMHSALTFRSESSSRCTGLVGIPMQEIKMYTE